MHLSCVCPCPPLLPVGFYWYGGNRRCSGRVPQWVERLLQEGSWDSGLDEESIQDAADSTMDQESIEDTGGIELPLSTQRDAQPEVTAARPCVNLRSVGVLCQVLEAHKNSEEEYENMKLGNSYLQSFYLMRTLQVTFGNAVAVSTLKQAYPWPLIVPVRNHFATFPTRTNLLVRAAILNQGHSKIDATTVTSDMCWSHSPPIVLTHVPNLSTRDLTVYEQ